MRACADARLKESFKSHEGQGIDHTHSNNLQDDSFSCCFLGSGKSPWQFSDDQDASCTRHDLEWRCMAADNASTLAAAIPGERAVANTLITERSWKEYKYMRQQQLRQTILGQLFFEPPCPRNSPPLGD